MSGFEVLAEEPVCLTGRGGPLQGRLMSPYVWKNVDGTFSMLVRRIEEETSSISAIWLACGDGLNFEAMDKPVIAPGCELIDINGCEDPTFVPLTQGCLVYYTGVRDDGTAQLLWASGSNAADLHKRGVAHASTASDRNTKEAALARHDKNWLMLFEYSRYGQSRIGRGQADGPSGPWRESEDPFQARPGRWDDYHLSTGPLLMEDPGGPLMFYNGATRDAVWSIGWVRLNEECSCATARCEAPLIAAPEAGGPQGRKISFAASALRIGEEIWLYYTHDDRSIRRARLRDKH